MIDKKDQLAALRLAAMTGVAAAALMAVPAFAQDADDDDEAVDDRDRIIVTGSRIARPDYISVSPVFTTTGEDIKMQGAVNIENFLNELPQIIPGLNQNSNNPGNGGLATANLRGIGSNRTLILVNGNRITPATNSGAYDLNIIPAGLVERTEVVTGGASTTYGSDAIAGVLNFILKDDFEGVQATSQYTISEAESHETFGANLLMGGNFDSGRGNATLYVDYFQRDQLLQGDLPFGADQGAFARSSRILEGRLSGQSGNPYDLAAWNASTGNGTFCAVDANNDGICDDANGNGFVDNGDFTIGGGSSLQFGTNGQLSGPAGVYNYAPPNAAILPQTRYVTRGSVNYEVVPNHTFTATATYVQNDIQAQLAPTPADFFVDPTRLANNPLIDPDVIALLNSRPNPNAPVEIRRRMQEVGNRINDIDRKYFEVAVGLEGPLDFVGDSWNYHIFAKHGSVDDTRRGRNNVSRSRLINGVEGCPVGSTPNCVPVTLFGLGSITPDMANYIRLDTATDLNFSQQVLSAYVDGNVFELPAGPVQVAMGYEYRNDKSDFVVSDAQFSGDIVGFNAIKPISGQISVNEFYGEVLVPLVKDQVFAESLEVEGGFRYSDYSSVGGLQTFKLGATWVPYDGIMVRGSYNEAARSPNIFELFRAGDSNFPTYADPCNANSSPSAAVQAFCVAQGVPAAGIGTFQQTDTQVESLNFGNPNLNQEDAESFTVGAVLTPEWLLPGLALTVDYYDIRLQGAISGRSVGQVIGGCFASLDLSNADCQAISRNPVSGQIDTINVGVSNVSSIETAGVDFIMSYRTDFADLPFFKTAPGGFGVRTLLTYVDKYTFDGSDILNGSGGGAGGALPQWRFTGSVTYDPTPDLRINWQARRIGTTAQPFAFVGNFPGIGDFGAPLPVVWYHDVGVSYQVNERFQLFGGVDNVFNRQPPNSIEYPGFQIQGQSGTDPSTYDILRRNFRIGATLTL